MTPGDIDRRAMELAFDALLSHHPTSLVAAVNPDGLFVPMPESFTIDRSRILQARSALDFVVADDRVQVIDAWYRAQDHGVGRTQVRLAASPDRTTQLYLFDLLERHGTYFCVVLLPVGAEEIRPEAVEGMASRVTWAIKTDRAAFRDVDPGIERMFGWTPDDLRCRSSLELVHPDDQELAIDNWMSMVSSGGRPCVS